MIQESYNLLYRVDCPNDLKKLSEEDVLVYAKQLRDFLIETILETGGHFSANLGTVELATALHYKFNCPEDPIVWDVGHQAYPHKVITGRRDDIRTIRQKDGISGFPKISESKYDSFGTGHSSTSISAMLGMAEADALQGKQHHYIAVIGDGSLTGGMAWEALNNAAISDNNILIIINDNQMGIDPNGGALNTYLNNIETFDSNVFQQWGFSYFGKDDGHDLKGMLRRLDEISKIQGPKIWHIRTVKGKGYAPAEKEQTKWHAVKYVKIKTNSPSSNAPSYHEVFGNTLTELADLNPKILAITPAMPSGSGLSFFQKQHPNRCFDVGIAEQHAVTFAAGMARRGAIPFCHVYSTFLQRGYDQVIHDVCLQDLPVVLCIDRGGVVGEDGATHHGIYDLAYLRPLPNLILAAPMTVDDFRSLLYTAANTEHPFAIRYPKGRVEKEDWQTPIRALEIGKGKTLRQGNGIGIISTGTLGLEAERACEELNSEGFSIGHFQCLFVKPLDQEGILNFMQNHRTLLTVEDGSKIGGLGEAITELAQKQGLSNRIHVLGYPDEVIPHGRREELLNDYLLSSDGLQQVIRSLVQR
jgi:1-deoxy-D-xylulose-5-phosphate synthase